MKKHFVLLAIALTFGQQSQAQSPNPGLPPFTAQNNILVLKFYPKDKSGKIFLVGKKAADLDFKKDAKLISVTLLNKGETEELRISPSDEGYTVETTKGFPSEYQLLMKAEVRGEPQQLKVRVNNRKP